MKAASAELIALLEAGKQLVMWETFVFTLANGTVLTYSNRDPDAPAYAYIPAPPPPPPDGFVFDSFTGTGTLNSHVGELGATWSLPSGVSSPGLDTAILTGNGTVYMNSSPGQIFNASGNAPVDSTPFYIEMDFYCAGDTSSWNGLRLSHGISHANHAQFLEAGVSISGGPSLSIRTSYFSGSGWTEDYASPDFSTLSPVLNTLRLEVDTNRQAARTYLNGDLLTSISLGSPLPVMSVPFLQWDNYRDTWFVSRFAGDTI
jgi:hypothetical protein